MATLTENATRIKDAADDIKSWIVAQGVTPTGRIETYKAALDSIPKLKTGTFTSNASGATINCGFVPKQVFVCVNLGTTAYSQLDMYKEGSYSGARGASINSGGTIGTATITVSGNTFTHKAFNTNYANKTAYYVAIG